MIFAFLILLIKHHVMVHIGVEFSTRMWVCNYMNIVDMRECMCLCVCVTICIYPSSTKTRLQMKGEYMSNVRFLLPYSVLIYFQLKYKNQNEGEIKIYYSLNVWAQFDVKQSYKISYLCCIKYCVLLPYFWYGLIYKFKSTTLIKLENIYVCISS